GHPIRREVYLLDRGPWTLGPGCPGSRARSPKPDAGVLPSVTRKEHTRDASWKRSRRGAGAVQCGRARAERPVPRGRDAADGAAVERPGAWSEGRVAGRCPRADFLPPRAAAGDRDGHRG